MFSNVAQTSGFVPQPLGSNAASTLLPSAIQSTVTPPFNSGGLFGTPAPGSSLFGVGQATGASLFGAGPANSFSGVSTGGGTSLFGKMQNSVFSNSAPVQIEENEDA